MTTFPPFYNGVEIAPKREFYWFECSSCGVVKKQLTEPKQAIMLHTLIRGGRSVINVCDKCVSEAQGNSLEKIYLSEEAKK